MENNKPFFLRPQDFGQDDEPDAHQVEEAEIIPPRAPERAITAGSSSGPDHSPESSPSEGNSTLLTIFAIVAGIGLIFFLVSKADRRPAEPPQAVTPSDESAKRQQLQQELADAKKRIKELERPRTNGKKLPEPAVEVRPAEPVPTALDLQDHAPAPVRIAESVPMRIAEPQLGVQEGEESTSGKPWVEAQDQTYVGKVIPCEGVKYDGSTVMGGDHVLNYFYMCLDVGTAFTKVKVDNLMNPVMFSYKGNDFHRAANLRKNDVVRVKVNDGQALKVEMIRSVYE